MAFLGDFFGSTKNQTTTSTNTSQANLPDWYKAYLDQNTKTGMGQLDTLANTTADQRFADFNPDELAAMERIRSGTGQYDDIIQGALGTMGQAQQRAFEGVNAEDIQKFMNPYTQNVTDITKRETVRDADIARAKLQGSAAAASGFGGSGHTIQQMELNRNLGQNLSDIEYKGQADAYQSALEAARQSNTDAIAAGSAIGGLASTGSNIYNNENAALATSGEAQRNMEQGKLDFTYTNPLQTTLQGSQLLNQNAGLYGTASSGTQTTPVEKAGWGSQLLGSAIAIGSMGTGGGATLGGTLLSSWLGKKDGGVVNMKDGREPMSELLKQMTVGAAKDSGSVTTVNGDGQSDLVSKNLSPAAKAVIDDVYVPGTEIPMKDTPGYENINDLQGVDDYLSKSAMERHLMGNDTLPASTIEEESPTSTALDVLSPDKPVEKSRLQRMIDDTNLPLLKMGLTMMGSDKDFLGAISEGGLAGASQIDKERASAAEQAKDAEKNRIDALKAQNEAIKNENTNQYKKSSLEIEALKAQGYIKNAEAQAEYAKSRGGSEKAFQKAKVDAAKAAQNASNKVLEMGGDSDEAELAGTTAFNNFMARALGASGQSATENGNMGDIQAPPANTTSNILSVDDVLNGNF